jgi:hypothetical protein
MYGGKIGAFMAVIAEAGAAKIGYTFTICVINILLDVAIVPQ